MRFDKKTAVISGGGGGMGLACALDLARAGAAVHVLDLKPRPAELEGFAAVTYHEGDATDEGFVAGVIDGAAGQTGRLDYLVNTTGVLWFDRDRSLCDMDMDVWDRVMEINLKSVVLTARHAVPHMKKSGGGAMVHVASIDATRGDTRPQDAYGASKAALIRVSKSLAIQFAADGIRSNTILPGPVHSPMQARWDDNAGALEAIADFVPLKRVGVPQDIANACLFLLSDQASFITGTELVVDGGCLALP